MIALRTLLLNCLTKPYAPLWERHWQAGWQQDSWSRQDARLKPFHTLQQTWSRDIPLRNAFERRQALVEIDVLSAMALGISLEELILIYEVQFPVLQQYEGDTWYDSRGNIVFTNSKGLVGLGVESKVWKTLRDLPAGQTYVHTIDKSELYRGQQIEYHAPFDRCNRAEDYRLAWAHFEKILAKA